MSPSGNEPPSGRLPRDCVIIGAGLAGLAAAEVMAGRDYLIVEAAGRAGGRLLSQARGPLWLNSGAHMFGGPDSPVGRLATLCGLELRAIRGRLMGMVDGRRRLLDRRAESYPFLMNLPLAARLSLMRMGVLLRRGSARSVAAQKRAARLEPEARLDTLHAFENLRTLAAATGQLHPRIAALLEAITERTGASPSEMSAGHGFRSFANVWSTHSPGNNLAGGSARLPEALAARHGARLRLGHRLRAVTRGPDGLLRLGFEGEAPDILTRSCLLAIPAPEAARIGAALPAAAREALGRIRYGAFLTLAVHLAPGAAPWGGHYAIATPGRSFSVLFDMGTTHRPEETAAGHSLMLFRGARGAGELLGLDDTELRARFLADLHEVFPETQGRVLETVIQRWPRGAPFSFPGRAALQPALRDLPPDLALAGDYLDFPNMDAAILSGEAAARRLRAHLERGSAPALQVRET